MQLLRKSGALILLVMAGIIGAVPAIGDDDTRDFGQPAAPVAPPSGETAAPAVPPAAAPAIADAVHGGIGSPTGSAAPAGSLGLGDGSSSAGGGSAGSPAPVSPTGPVPAPPPPSPGPPEVARVTGLSFVLDILDLGAGIGFDTVFGLVVSGFGTIVPTDQLPPELVSGAYDILAVPPEIFDQFAEPTAEGLAALRAAVAPLAATNPGANALLTALSQALVAAGTDGRALTNPLDAQVVQLGQFLLVLQEDG